MFLFSKCILISELVATGKKLNSVQSLEIALTLHDTQIEIAYTDALIEFHAYRELDVSREGVVFSAGRQVRSGEELIIKATRLRGSIEVAY